MNKVFEKIPILKKIDKILIKYLFISVITTLADILFLFILVEAFGINYLISATISYCIGIIIGYIGQKKITFRDKNKKIIKQFFTFTVVSLIGLLINLGVLKLFVEFFGIHYMISKIIAIGIGFIWNYSINKKITFK